MAYPSFSIISQKSPLTGVSAYVQLFIHCLGSQWGHQDRQTGHGPFFKKLSLVRNTDTERAFLEEVPCRRNSGPFANSHLNVQALENSTFQEGPIHLEKLDLSFEDCSVS